MSFPPLEHLPQLLFRVLLTPFQHTSHGCPRVSSRPYSKQGRCFICKDKCQVTPLTDQSPTEVKELFSKVNVAAKKQLSEIKKVAMFQVKHSRKLVAYYRKRNERLEADWVKMKQEMQKMTKKMNEQTAYIAKLEHSFQSLKSSSSSMGRTSHSLHEKQAPQMLFSSPMPLSRHSSSCNISGDNTDRDEQLSFLRKPPRAPSLSLFSPLHDGGTGTIPHRLSSQMTNHFTFSQWSRSPTTPGVLFGPKSIWNSPVFRDYPAP
ncbi:probable E3 SUMO-protein ligase RNF212 isoform X2 [Syngnathus scovelli]|uniref:probable E3 SUMO-protein ligase RNF212 isoform X2 n=1 Tax=Syngnathus scovelli TaxID=161590 RepID=UPI00210F79B2|nr:probable E3 SUMO-protein ligase RNF212 isoform X2 [Syngnathus scovelli]